MDKEKVLNLAKLARIDIADSEADRLATEFDAILGYVGEVKEISKADSLQLTADSFVLKNVMREDGEPHEPGIYTEQILSQAPQREGDYLKVKKIL
ncbi:MAG: Asp-tRNA(Asn)/Glu-tRNA(Gln) amidotransferase subunit GatC [Candidatus Zambryskibacteria bacterium]|nr:Asp-tRNA(Asn)/Glu-tRNA(Gln) amidotransferase subunit GatC [Candidatus Zambryskibacteria bacterium]